MARDAVEAALALAVDELRASGGVPTWPGNELAPIAYRRWNSFSRRKRGRLDTIEQRIDDLMKGLQKHFEPGTPYTHPNDWRSLALALAEVFQKFETTENAMD
jgi:hypothetical protein